MCFSVLYVLIVFQSNQNTKFNLISIQLKTFNLKPCGKLFLTEFFKREKIILEDNMKREKKDNTDFTKIYVATPPSSNKRSGWSYGWVCPKCGSVWAIWVDRCKICSPGWGYIPPSKTTTSTLGYPNS